MTTSRNYLIKTLVILMAAFLIAGLMPMNTLAGTNANGSKVEIKATDKDGTIACTAPGSVESIKAKHEKKFVKVNMIFKPGSEVEVDSDAHISMNGVDLNKYKDSLVIFAYPETDFDPSVKKTAMLDLYIYPLRSDRPS